MGDVSNKEQAIGCIGTLVVIALVIAAFVAVGNYREAQAEKGLPPVGFFERIELLLRPSAYAKKEIARVARITEARQDWLLQTFHHGSTQNISEASVTSAFDADDVKCDQLAIRSLELLTSLFLRDYNELENSLNRFTTTALSAAASRENVYQEIYEALPWFVNKRFADEFDRARFEANLSLQTERVYGLAKDFSGRLSDIRALCLSRVSSEPVFIYSRGNADGVWQSGRAPAVMTVDGHPGVSELALRTLTYRLFSSETTPTPSRELFSAAPFLTFTDIEVGTGIASVTELQATCPAEASVGDVYTTTFYAFPLSYATGDMTQAFSFPVTVACLDGEQRVMGYETPIATSIGPLSQNTIDNIERTVHCSQDLDPLLNLESLKQTRRRIQHSERQEYDDNVAEVLSELKGYDVRLAREEALANAETAFTAEFQETRAILDASCYREITVMNDVIAESVQYDGGGWRYIDIEITIEFDVFPEELSWFSEYGVLLDIVRLSETPELDDFPLPKHDVLRFNGDSFVRMRDGIQLTSSERFIRRCPENAQVGDEYHATYYAYSSLSFKRLKGFEFDVTLRCVAESQN